MRNTMFGVTGVDEPTKCCIGKIARLVVTMMMMVMA